MHSLLAFLCLATVFVPSIISKPVADNDDNRNNKVDYKSLIEDLNDEDFPQLKQFSTEGNNNEESRNSEPVDEVRNEKRQVFDEARLKYFHQLMQNGR